MDRFKTFKVSISNGSKEECYRGIYVTIANAGIERLLKVSPYIIL